MSAAAAAALTHEARWNAYFARAGFVRCPHGFRKVLVACSQVEAALAWHVLQSTVGARKAEKPEWVVLTEPEAARIACCSPNGAARALDRLEELGILQSERLGRTRRYRVQLENWDSLKARQARQLERKPPAIEEEEPDEASATLDGPAEPVAAFRASSAPLVLMPTPNARPVPLAAAVRQVRAIGYDGVSLSLRVDGETLELTVAKKEANREANKGRTIETLDCLNRADKSNGVNKTNSALRNMLNAELGAKIGPVDDGILQRIDAARGSATIDDLRARIVARRRSIETWGLVPQIARDVAQAAATATAATNHTSPTPDAPDEDCSQEFEQFCQAAAQQWIDNLPPAERKRMMADQVKLVKQTYPAAATYWKPEQIHQTAESQLRTEALKRLTLPSYREFVRARRGAS